MLRFVSDSRRTGHQETDYQARVEFLRATNELMSPAPIDALLRNAAPLFEEWRAHQPGAFEDPIAGAMAESMTLGFRVIPGSDDSSEAAAVRTAVARWMEAFGFQDSWIAEAAVTTLFVHSSGEAAQRSWYVQPPWEQMNPGKSDVPERRGNESTEDYIRRLGRQLRALDSFRKGARAYQAEPARWTVLRFMGKTFKEIAASASDVDTVRKAVRAFAARAGLTLPSRSSGNSR